MKLQIKICAAALALLLSATAGAGPALDRVMEKKVLTVATDANWPPQSFLNDENEMDGFDVEVAKEIARRLGVGVAFVTPLWDIITSGHWQGRWDISVGSMTPTRERGRVLDFPAVYYYLLVNAAVHEDSAVTTIAGLNGKNIGVTTASTHELYLKKELSIASEDAPPFTYQVTPGKISSYERYATAADDLRLGDGVRLDAVLGALPNILKNIEAGYPFRVVGAPVFYEPIAIAIDKGDAEFKNRLREIVLAMHEDGTLSRLSKKWFDKDYSRSYPVD